MFMKPTVFHSRKKSVASDLKSENSASHRNFVIDLTELENGNPAKVFQLRGSRVLNGRLEAMGILPGTMIVKKSAIPAKGPIVIEKGTTQFAVGFDMARNILVEPVEQKN